MELLDYLPTIPDFPKPGVMFRDISPLLANRQAFAQAVAQMNDLSQFCEFDYLVGIESRGFIFAAAMASQGQAGLIMARKRGKLPVATYAEPYGLEYGQDALEIEQTILPKGARVLLIDDVLATGGSLNAAAALVARCGAQVSGALVLLEIAALKGAQALTQHGIMWRALLRA
jgi:adenine phosphoribosyltransferase